jgi:hypothetical protein
MPHDADQREGGSPVRPAPYTVSHESLFDREEMIDRTFAGFGTVITVHDVTACELDGG